MHGEIFVTAGGGDLADYLNVGPSARPVDPNSRVAWREAYNLPSDDPAVVARVMRATAATNLRCTRPLLHIVVSYPPGDGVRDDVMRSHAQRTIKDLGLDEHQVYAVAHKDKHHAHFHLMVLRVHPVTGRAWDEWKSHTKLERSLRHQERAAGFRVNPGRLFRLDGQARPDRTQGLSRAEFRHWERHGFSRRPEHLPLQYLVQEKAAHHFRAFCETGDRAALERGLAESGFALEPRGSGHVVVAGLRMVAISRIDADAPTGFTHPEVTRAAARVREYAALLELKTQLDETITRERATEAQLRLRIPAEERTELEAARESLLQRHAALHREIGGQEGERRKRTAAAEAVSELGADPQRLRKLRYILGRDVVQRIGDAPGTVQAHRDMVRLLNSGRTEPPGPGPRTRLLGL